MPITYGFWFVGRFLWGGMMIKLTKVKSCEWLGNGFGDSRASWVVKGAEHITINHLSNYWVACDSSKIVESKYGDRHAFVANGHTRKELLDTLEKLDLYG